MSELRYPVGKFEYAGPLTEPQRQQCIREIEEAPRRLRAAVDGLSAEQLDTPYRPGGWTVRQVVHHLPDSHLNAYVRFRLALTEDGPMVKTYEEGRWAELADARTAPVEISLGLLATLHQRWVLLLKAMTAEQFAREFRHPELGQVPLGKSLAMYAWHGRHHIAHITALRQRMGWV